MLRCWVSLVLLGTASLPAYGQELKWKFNKGDTFYLETVSSFKQTMNIGKPTTKEGKSAFEKELEVKQDVEHTAVLSFTVKEKNADNSVVIEEKVLGMRVKKEGGTSVPDDKIQGAVFRITLNPKGEVTNFEGYDELLKKVAGDDATTLKALQSVWSKESLEKSAQEAFAFLPEKPDLKTWEREFKAPRGPLGSMLIKNKYTREGRDKVEGKPVEKISFASTVTYKEPTALEAQGGPFRVNEGKLQVEDAKGAIQFDPVAGRLVACTQTLRLKGQLTLSLDGKKLDTQIAQEQTIKTRVLASNPLQK